MFIPSNTFISALAIAALFVGTGIAKTEWIINMESNIDVGSGLCLYVHDTPANNVEVDVNTCDYTSKSIWDVNEDGSIRMKDFCLDVSGSNFANETQLELYQCLGNTAQMWTIDKKKGV